MRDADGTGVRRQVTRIVANVDGDKTRLLDALAQAQAAFGSLSDDVVDALAAALGLHRAEILDAATFYAFFTREAGARVEIRLARTPISLMRGAGDVMRALETATGARTGTPSADGIRLSWTSDTGMADQEPSALVNGAVFTNLVPADAATLIAAVRAAPELPAFPGYATARLAHPKHGCTSRIAERGPVLLAPFTPGSGLERALASSPDAVIDEIARSGLRGRGGAGFPTGMKWRLTRRAPGDAHYIICNADEGEPGTFKDRVLLAETPRAVFEGLVIAGYALGATLGLVYLRAEYAYLAADLQAVLAAMRRDGHLGERVGGRDGFAFDIRLRLGAGAYVCGEESALIESLEGKRGTPRERPPYPTDRGYLNQPTAVNNVETLACVPRILAHGADWFARFGTAESKGTKLMCLSGDCERPGVYEVPFGITLNELLDRAGGSDAQAVQVSGAAGQCVAPKDYGRSLCYEDLSTGGSTMVFGPQRDLLAVVLQFAEFFAEESCGWCAPCRVGTVVLKESVERALQGRADAADVVSLKQLATTVANLSRCGLGQTAPNPILTTLRDFPHIYETRLREPDALRIDLAAALREAAGERA